MTKHVRRILGPLPLLGLLVLPLGLNGQAIEELRVSPTSIDVPQGETVSFEVEALDAQGNVVPDAELRITGAGQGFSVDAGQRTVTGTRGGTTGQLIISQVLPAGAEGQPAAARVPIEVGYPTLSSAEIHAPEQIFAHTAIDLRFAAYHSDGSERPDVEASWRSSDEQVASVNRFGELAAHRAGTVTVTASYQGVEASREVQVQEFPTGSLQILGGVDQVRMGDVVELEARVTAADGQVYEGIPVDWGYSFRSVDGVRQPGATALLDNGRFVAQEPGVYTLIASAGPLTSRHAVEVEERHVVQRVEFQGQGRVDNVHTSDFWVFEGNDGRDYAISGTWGADGWAYMWDVTDRSNLVKTDSVQVDARTVNDVKVSPGARYATMTREGASTRRNGLVILDLEDPAHPVVASIYEEGLTGGVHNAFPMEDYVYTLSAGEKYVIIDVSDIYNPRTVGEVQHENCRIHDVWVEDGLAYSAQWACGVLVYDVGNGQWGGTPENPVFVSQLTTPGGRTHAVYPYYQESTGRLLVFAGDEIMNRRGMALEGGLSREPYDPETGEGGRPSNTAGYTHILDFTDMDNPKKIARYKVPEYGTHNIWVEDDVLYQAYYEGGVRVVDVSGDLMGNLATQGREIAVYKPADPAGYIANAPMVWSAMPFKGEVFFSDWNSGMWTIQLQPLEPLTMEEEDN
jgi:hypothetical protein